MSRARRRSAQIEIEGASARFETSRSESQQWSRWGQNALRVRLARVDAAFFDAFAVTPIVGRTFRVSDVGTGHYRGGCEPDVR